MVLPLFQQARNLFVFTAANPPAQHNLTRSITSPIPDRLVERHFIKEGVDIHTLKSDQSNGFYAWGAFTGPYNDTTWHSLKQGDIILTAYNNAYHYVSTVLAKFHAPEFAGDLWGRDDSNQTWELMYFLSQPIPLGGIPYTENEDYLRSTYRGFTSIGSVSGNLLEAIYQDFGSLENFCDLRLNGYKPALIPPVYNTNEDSALEFDPSNKEDGRKKILRSIHQRRGQKKFRTELMQAYEGSCAITGETCAAVLEAAHITPYRGDHTNHVQNGILLRADIHTLFDLNLITVDSSSYQVRISDELNGTSYNHLKGSFIALPTNIQLHPNRNALLEHNNLYKAVNE